MAKVKSTVKVEPAQNVAAKKLVPPAAKNWATSSLVIAGCIAAITFLFLSACLDNGFVNWDDPGYVTGNPLVAQLSGKLLHRVFTENVMGNYHPFTILSYVLEFSAVKLEPWLYHFDSLLLHVVTTVLAYYLAVALTGRKAVAIVTALLFGLHPMHVESVAWVAGRKDVLYGAFFMASSLLYVRFASAIGNKRWIVYALSVLLFLCSLLSKPVAVSLAVTLFIYDYLLGRKWSTALLLEKLPYLALAVVFGIKSLSTQGEIGQINRLEGHYNILDRTAMGMYALVTYVWKAVAPLGLRCFYPYPEKTTGMLPVMYYASIAIVAVLAFVIWRYARHTKLLMAGIGFFIANILLLLQFIPVGGAIVSERYSYIPYFGLFMIAGYAVALMYEQPQRRSMIIWSAAVYIGLLGAMAYVRCNVWQDSHTLWANQMEQQPDDPNAYNNMADDYMLRLKVTNDPMQRNIYNDSAQLLYKASISKDSEFVNPIIALGTWHRINGDIATAKKYFYRAVSLRKGNLTPMAYQGLAVSYFVNQELDSAEVYFGKAIQEQYFYPQAHVNFGNLMDARNNAEAAIKEYGIALEQSPGSYEAYLNRGRTYMRIDNAKAAVADFAHVIEIKPDEGEAYYLRAQCRAHLGDKAGALQDVESAANNGYTEIDGKFVQQLQQ